MSAFFNKLLFRSLSWKGDCNYFHLYAKFSMFPVDQAGNDFIFIFKFSSDAFFFAFFSSHIYFKKVVLLAYFLPLNVLCELLFSRDILLFCYIE